MKGLDKLVDITLKHKNFAMSYKLVDILLSEGEGGKIKQKSFCKLLKLAINTEAEEDVLSTSRIGQKLGLLTNKVLKKHIFPNLHILPELVVPCLEDVGVERKISVTPLIEWLISQGKTEAASTLAGIFSEDLDKEEIYHCLSLSISKHFQKGDIEGAGMVLQLVLDQKISISQHMLRSLIKSAIQRHEETRDTDIVRSHGVIKQWDLSHSLLACIYSSAGDWEAVVRLMSGCHSRGLIADEECKELIHAMSMYGNKEHISKLLSLANPVTTELGNI